MIGLIFGETDFPKEILKKVRNKKRYLIIDLTKKKIYKNEKRSHSVAIGQFGKIIKLLKKNHCKEILFAGKVIRPNLSKLKLDFKGIYYFPRIIKSAKLGDAAILKEVINIFEKENIKTVSSLKFTPHLTLKTGIYTKLKPNNSDNKDIKVGLNILNKNNNYSFSQAVIIRDNKVLAIEGKDGTQKMLKKKKYKTNIRSGVLIKLPKKKQDIRIDLPTVGIETLKQCFIAGLKGVVLRSKLNVFLNKKACIDYANKNKIFIKVI